MMVRRKSEDGELFQWVIIRSQTPMEIVSATATRRAVFAMMPTGLAAVANSDIAAEDTFMRLPERASSAWRVERKQLSITGGHGITTDKRVTPNQQALNVSLLLAPIGCANQRDISIAAAQIAFQVNSKRTIGSGMS